MRILLYGINYFPELTGIGKYTGELAPWLAGRGHEVRVVTAPPYYPEWRVKPPWSAWRWRRETHAGVQVWRCPLWVPGRQSGLRRVLHLVSFALSSLPVLLRQAVWRPDALLVVEPAFACAPGALLAGALAGAGTWLHVQDYEVDAAFGMGLLKGERLRAWVLRAEAALLHRFDRVSSISGRMVDLAVAKGVQPDRVRLFPNWVEIAAIYPLHRASEFRVELDIPPERLVALYSGNMGAKQGLEILAEAARLLQAHPRLHFVFCGDGAGRASLQEQCEGLANVTLLPLQPLTRLNELLNLADIHLLPQRADAADLVLPSKLTGMLASGRPVVVTAALGTELATVVQDQARCGIVVPPEQPEAFAAAVAELADATGERRRELGAAGRRHAESAMDRDAILRTFEAELLTLVDE